MKKAIMFMASLLIISFGFSIAPFYKHVINHPSVTLEFLNHNLINKSCAEEAYKIFYNCTTHCNEGDVDCFVECKEKTYDWVKDNCYIDNNSYSNTTETTIIEPYPYINETSNDTCLKKCAEEYNSCQPTSCAVLLNGTEVCNKGLCYRQYKECVAECTIEKNEKNNETNNLITPINRTFPKETIKNVIIKNKTNNGTIIYPKHHIIGLENCTNRCRIQYKNCLKMPMTQQCIKLPNGTELCSNKDKCEYYYNKCIEMCTKEKKVKYTPVIIKKKAKEIKNKIIKFVDIRKAFKEGKISETEYISYVKNMTINYINTIENYVMNINTSDPRIAEKVTAITLTLENIKQEIIFAQNYSDLKKVYKIARKQLIEIKQEIKKIKIYEILNKVSEKIRNKKISEKLRKIANDILLGKIKPDKRDILKALRS